MTKASGILEEVRDAYVIGDSAYSSREMQERVGARVAGVMPFVRAG